MVEGKIYNPKTKRYINDTAANRKRIGIVKKSTKKSTKRCPTGCRPIKKRQRKKSTAAAKSITLKGKKIPLIKDYKYPFITGEPLSKKYMSVIEYDYKQKGASDADVVRLFTIRAEEEYDYDLEIMVLGPNDLAELYTRLLLDYGAVKRKDVEWLAKYKTF